MLNFICYAFDQYENCTEVIYVADAGPVDLTFTKTSVMASVSNGSTKLIDNGRIQSTYTSIDDFSSARASGSALGSYVNTPNGSVGLIADYYSSADSVPRVSDLLAPRLTKAARQRLEMLELKIGK
jgi:hypothetical protein